MKRLFIFLISIYSLFFSAQRKKTYYHNISENYLLYFENDSIVKIQEFPKHMSSTLSKDLKYRKNKDKIEIFLGNLYPIESEKFNLSGIETLTLRQENGFLINDEKKILFEVYRMKSPFYTIIIFDGKKYKKQEYRSNSYGLLEGNPKENSELEILLEKIEKESGKYTVTSFSGYEAYKKFGKQYVNGVIIVANKFKIKNPSSQ